MTDAVSILDPLALQLDILSGARVLARRWGRAGWFAVHAAGGDPASLVQLSPREGERRSSVFRSRNSVLSLSRSFDVCFLVWKCSLPVLLHPFFCVVHHIRVIFSLSAL